MGGGAGTPPSGTPEPSTRLSQWHPYPAMVPDDLALAIAAHTVKPGNRVLDPFCGSGRLLMAASALGGACVGFDVNPLACLITEAKAVRVSIETIADIAHECPLVARSAALIPGVTLRGTAVNWFSDSVAAELAQIISWINSLDLSRPAMLVVATALSAATRDASWIRKSGWKLHRMGESDRSVRIHSAWASFAARLHHYVEAANTNQLVGSIEVRRLAAERPVNNLAGRFDVVITSPPYGDSRTTVQYGAASAICLDVISRLQGLEDVYVSGSEIDASCLGGPGSPTLLANVKRFWAGAPETEGGRRVSTFLAGFATFCRQTPDFLKPSGTLVMVVGRRSVRGFRVKLDEFAVAEMEEVGFRTERIERRRLQSKRLPRTINRFARSASADHRSSGRTKTMDEEIILTFSR